MLNNIKNQIMFSWYNYYGFIKEQYINGNKSKNDKYWTWFNVLLKIQLNIKWTNLFLKIL